MSHKSGFVTIIGNPNVGKSSTYGSSQTHSHGFTSSNFNLNVAYTDVIIAQKN